MKDKSLVMDNVASGEPWFNIVEPILDYNNRH